MNSTQKSSNHYSHSSMETDAVNMHQLEQSTTADEHTYYCNGFHLVNFGGLIQEPLPWDMPRAIHNKSNNPKEYIMKLNTD